MSQTAHPYAAPQLRPSAATSALFVLAAIVGALVGNTVVAAIAHAAGASDDFGPLKFGAFAFFTVVGILAGTGVWALVRARAKRPASVLRVLIPVVIAVSLIPDLLVGAGGSMAGTTWGGVVALMIMHVLTAAVAVPALMRALPVTDPAPARV